MEAFTPRSDAYLDAMHTDAYAPLEQTLRAGTRKHDNLIGRGHESVERLRARIDEALLSYMSRMQDRAPQRLRLSYQPRLSLRLDQLVYYVSPPDEIEDETRQRGWLKFGEPSLDAGLTDPVRRTVKPVVGRLVLFPSYMWHGTIPFRSRQQRTTIAFNVIPR